MKKSTLITSLGLGIAAGALAGFLFGTEKGRKTRDELTALTDDYSDFLREELDDIKSTVNDKYDNYRDEAEKLYKNGKSKAEALKNDLEKAAK